MIGFAVVGRIDCVEIAAICTVLRNAKRIAEALIVDDFALTQKLQRIAHVGIVDQTEKIVIGDTRFLFCYYHVFATKLSLAKVRKILMFQGVSALLELTIFQKFQ